MHESIEEMQGTEIQVQRLAINASVRASHIGASGEALAVLAGAMERLSADCRERCGVVNQALASMNRSTEALSAPVRSDSGNGEETLNELRAAVRDLHTSSEQSFSRIAQIVTRSSRLCDELSGTRDSLSVGTLFEDVVGRVRDALAQLEPGEKAAADGLDLHDLSVNYTMQAERDVHAVVTGGAAAEAPALALAECGEGETMSSYSEQPRPDGALVELIGWTPDCSVHVPEIDLEHQASSPSSTDSTKQCWPDAAWGRSRGFLKNSISTSPAISPTRRR